MNVNRS